jgi:hypothetical protein
VSCGEGTAQQPETKPRNARKRRPRNAEHVLERDSRLVVSPREGPDWAPKPPFDCEHEIALTAGNRSCFCIIRPAGVDLLAALTLPEAMRCRRVRSRRPLASGGIRRDDAFNIDTGGTALRLRWRWGPEQVQAFPERRLPPDEKHPDIARHPVGKVDDPRRKVETLRLQIMAPS